VSETAGTNRDGPSEPDPDTAPDALIDLRDVSVVVDGRKILGPLSWRVESDHHWVVLGPNGSGKSTLMAVASLGRHPSDGTVRVLGHELGRVDIRPLRARVGVSSAALADQLRGRLTAAEVVMCGLHAALEPWWHHYTDADAARAGELLARVGLASYDHRTLATLSSGERQRTLLARTLMADPDVVVLDEPTAGLDLGGREALVVALDAIAAGHGPATVFVTHHVDDIPASTTHLLALADGRPLACGPVGEVLTADLLTQMFGLPVDLERRDGRWSARARPGP
jgi:iron complex transport system ATP-binding protein